MPYLGNDLQVAQPSYRNIDDISGSFNSSTTSFPLLVSGSAPVPFPINSNQCLISVAGVVQRPDDSGTEGFRISGGNIIFSSAPSTGADFFGVILAGADYVNVGANFPSGSAAVPSITFDSDLDTGIYNSAANQVSVTTAGTERLRIDSAGQIESVSLGSASAPAFSFTTDPNTGIYSPGADQVAISTNGTGRLFITDTRLRLNVNSQFHISNNTDASSGLQFIGSDSAESTIGTMGNHALTFRTNSVERMRLTSTGLGIGTTSPSTSLHVSNASNAEIRLGSGSYDAYIGQDSSGVLAISQAQAGSIKLQTNGSERARITSDGRLGVGTSTWDLNSVSTKVGIRLSGTTGDGISLLSQQNIANQYVAIGSQFDNTNTNNGSQIRFGIDSQGDTYSMIAFATANGGTPSEKMRLDRLGRLLVGTSTARDLQTHNAKIQLEGVGYQNSTISVYGNSSDSNGSYIQLGKSRGSSVGSNTIVQNGDQLGAIHFLGADGTNNHRAAWIIGEVDGIPGANDMPGRLVFSTTADGASSPTERMRIHNNGDIAVGTAAANGYRLELNKDGGTLFLNDTNSGNSGSRILSVFRTGTFNTSDTTSQYILFQRGDTTTCGSITRNGTVAVAYNTSSDYRLKENIKDVVNPISRISQLKPCNFNFVGEERSVDGFIAHEVQSVVPEAITGEKDAVDEDGNPIYQGIDQSKLVPLLTAALQEAIGEIESLKARVAALESA